MPNDFFNSSEVTQACADVILYSMRFPRPENYNKAIEFLYPYIIDIIKAYLYKQKLDSERYLHDWTQITMLRLYKTKFREQNTENPERIVYATIHAILNSLFVDIIRRKNTRKEQSVAETPVKNENPEEFERFLMEKLRDENSPETVILLREYNKKIYECIQRFLANTSNKQAQLLDLDLNAPDLTNLQKAEKLGVTLVNLYQLRTRYKKALIECMESMFSRE